MENSWKSGYFSNLFLKANWEIQLDTKGFYLNKKFYEWGSIESLSIKSGLVWNTLNFKAKKNIKIEGLPKDLSRELFAFLSNIKPLIKSILLLDQNFQKNSYFRNYEVQQIKKSMPEYNEFDFLLNSKKIHIKTLINSKKLTSLHKIIKSDNSEINAWNKEFIENEKGIYSSYFKNVETSPLTDEQIEASIVMEDNNLLVAAAGSGKTSVIVSKLGYLIEKGYAKPEEVLILAFNNKVRDEINERIRNRLKKALENKKIPIVHTFHSYGYSIIKDGKLNKKTPAWISNESATSSHLKDLFYKAMNADDKLALDAALFITFEAIDETEEVLRLFSATKSESLNQIAKLTYEDIERSAIKVHKTLNNKIVRSGQEFKICNWLILHDINYEYEKHLDIKEISDYHPDFYYPDSDSWHEHFGINKYGKAPMHFSLNRPLSYEEIVRRKRKFLNQNKIRWFETTSADFYDDSWYISLDKRLKEFGEKPRFIGWERYRTKVHKFNKDNKEKDDLYSELPLINLISTAIKHFKNNQLTFDDIDNKISATKNKLRCLSFLKIFKAIFTEYQNELKADNSIDFEDMISESTRLIDLNKVKHQFKVILVDEFQDMSNSRSRLIQSLKKQNSETIFFAVGDDWQSIYRFAGSDISNMVNFESKFGFTSVNKLNMTFRFNQGIADVSSEFIQKNPLQIRKSVTSINLGRKNKIRQIFHDPVSKFDSDTKRWIKTPESFNRELLNQLNIVESYAASKGTKVSVAFISRYHFLKPDHFDDLSKTFKKNLNIIFTTMHSSKGLGFDFVFIFGMNSSFPSKRTDDEIIRIFMPEPDNFEFSEERRLFYVALTRAKKAVMLFIDNEKQSPFILELSSSKYLDVID